MSLLTILNFKLSVSLLPYQVYVHTIATTDNSRDKDRFILIEYHTLALYFTRRSPGL